VNLEVISCLCLTYGRPSLLEESIECFKRQTWTGRKELLIINDLPDQKLLFDDDEVVIVNLNRRVRTLGEKRNLSAALARYDYLFIWDDDDIYLPWRLDETMKYLPERRFFKSAAAWVINRGVLKTEPAVENIEPIPNMNFAGGPRFYVTTPIDRQDEPCLYLFHGGAAYTRTLFEEIRGYSCVNSGEDLDFENRLKQHPKLAACFNSTVFIISIAATMAIIMPAEASSMTKFGRKRGADRIAYSRTGRPITALRSLPGFSWQGAR
jgi:glycosyltransferase involved in cell wall biosynthesis